ncbi:MAG: hypothetical protein LBK66_03945 [Spirochaetaceae bacterium]|jgi:hypothetical protein|nr:hypothetical protein [Spirochaetaceae bacterium]
MKKRCTLSEKATRLIPPMQLAVTVKSREIMETVSGELNRLVENIPKLYETDGNEDAKISLHYFYGSIDYYVLEWDNADTFFGYLVKCNSLDNSEIGYQSKAELFKSLPLLNLDYYFEQRHIDEILK